MKPVIPIAALVALCCLPFGQPSDPPLSTVADEQLSAYATVGPKAVPYSDCGIDSNFQPVHHTGRRHLLYLFGQLAWANGIPAESYAIELMRDSRGLRRINAMTCPGSRFIWVSVTAWELLSDSDAALTLLLAHELGHADHRPAADLRRDPMTDAERKLVFSLTLRQLSEVAVDQRAADLMRTAGYTDREIAAAAHLILARDTDGVISKATESHPAGRDRVNLLTYYLGREQEVLARK